MLGGRQGNNGTYSRPQKEKNKQLKRINTKINQTNNITVLLEG